MNNKYADILKEFDDLTVFELFEDRGSDTKFIHKGDIKKFLIDKLEAREQWWIDLINSGEGIRIFAEEEVKKNNKQWIEALGEDEKKNIHNFSVIEEADKKTRNKLRKKVLKKMKLNEV